MEAFPEVSGILDEEDSLEEFGAYLLDPVNCGPTLYTDQRFIYHTHIGVRQQGRFWGKQHIVRLGIETHAEETRIHYTSSTYARPSGQQIH
ncbi:MAG: hypothetical protein NPIRA01_38610 [Nitrospirales bacterium]|nr:MAG: hypothetical protein NPIRA01_38610 [Nitrospirales bacterium]